MSQQGKSKQELEVTMRIAVVRPNSDMASDFTYTPTYTPHTTRIDDGPTDNVLSSTTHVLDSLVSFYQQERMWVYQTRAMLQETSTPQLNAGGDHLRNHRNINLSKVARRQGGCAANRNSSLGLRVFDASTCNLRKGNRMDNRNLVNKFWTCLKR